MNFFNQKKKLEKFYFTFIHLTICEKLFIAV